MKKFFFVLYIFIVASSAAIGNEKKRTNKPVEVVVDFIYHSFPGKVEIYDVKNESQLDISETRNVKNRDELPVLKRNGGKFSLRPGQSRTVVLVVENNSGKDWYFNATPHAINPIEASVGQKFECLCNHAVFRADKKALWYRIVRFELDKDFAAPSIRLTHNILGIKSEDAKEKYNEMLFDK